MTTKHLLDLFPIAKLRGVLKPQESRDICLSDSLNTANGLLYLLYVSDGLSTSQLVNRSKLSKNTILCYLRALVSVKLATKDKEAQEEATWYYVEQKN
jgi:hypothetical protein